MDTLDLLIPLSQIVLGVGLSLIVWSVTGAIKFKLRLKDETIKFKKRKKFPLLNLVFPFMRTIAERTGADVKLKYKIDAAHIDFTPAEFLNLKLLLTVLLSLIGFFVFSPKGHYIVIVLLAIGGWVGPDLLMRRKISARKELIVKYLPETVDLLTLCIDAGFDFTTAMKWIIEKTNPNPMTEELAFVLEEIKWGKARIAALADMGKRLNVSEVTSFVQTLKQAENMGTPIAEALSMLSEDTRHMRFMRGERLALQAPLKMLIPLIFCILPCIVIVVAVPILLQFTQGPGMKLGEK